MDKTRVRNFLREYYQLCRKYGLIVDACGCCESPWLSDLIEPDSTPPEEEFSLSRIASSVCRNAGEEIIREILLMHIEHLVSEAGFTKEEIKEFIQELKNL